MKLLVGSYCRIYLVILISCSTQRLELTMDYRDQYRKIDDRIKQINFRGKIIDRRMILIQQRIEKAVKTIDKSKALLRVIN